MRLDLFRETVLSILRHSILSFGIHLRHQAGFAMYRAERVAYAQTHSSLKAGIRVEYTQDLDFFVDGSF